MNGFFISVEGGEGVGKSVFVAGLSEVLAKNSVPFIKSFEPGGTPTADRLRSFFLTPAPEDPLLPETELFVVSAARAQHVGAKLKPTLARGDWVVCDRFADSTRVYQGIMASLPEQLVETVIAASTANLAPDLTFLLDCDVSTALKRVQGRGGEKSRFDAKEASYHEGLRQAYLAVAGKFPERIVIIDASRRPEDVLKEAMAHVCRKSGRNLRY